MEREEKSRKNAKTKWGRKKGNNVVYICSNDVDNRSFWNVGELLQIYTTSQPETRAVKLGNESPRTPQRPMPHDLRTSSLEMRCSYMQYRRRHDSLVSYRLVGRSKKPVASYGGRTLSCLSACPQVAFGCVNAHNMMVSVAYHNYPIQDSSSLISRGWATRRYLCLYEEE